MKLAMFFTFLVLLTGASDDAMAGIPSAGYDSVSSGYGYFGYNYPQLPRPGNNAQVVETSVSRNQTGSFAAASLFDSFDVPYSVIFTPERATGQPYGGSEPAKFAYIKTMKAGDFAVNCSIVYFGKNEIDGNAIKSDFLNAGSFKCDMAFYSSVSPNFDLPVVHTFTDDISNPLIQAILKHGGLIEIDGRDSYWYQTNPSKFQAVKVELRCAGNSCSYMTRNL